MESGPKYAVTKEGLIKLIVIIFGCITFAMLADTTYYRVSDRMTFVFAAFIISFCVSVLFYLFRVTGLSDKMSCNGPCSYDGFDFIWSWFSTIWCLAAAIVFAVDFPTVIVYSRYYNELITGVVFAFLTAVAYAVEAFVLKERAPANIGYVATLRGWLKTVIIAFGAAAFGLLVDSGYAWCGRSTGCYAGITYALTVYIIGWAITVFIWFGHMAGLIEKKDVLKKFEFIWSIICVLLFWTASSCFAAYTGCSGNQFDRFKVCQMRLSGLIIGFVTGVLYIVDAVLNRAK